VESQKGEFMSITAIENYGCTNEYSNIDELEIENESEEIIEKSPNQSDKQDSISSEYEFLYCEDDYQNVIYGKRSVDDVDEKSHKFIEGLLNFMNGVEELEFKFEDGDTINSGEIYAIYISDGKVHVQGGSGYEDKAAAYEKLLNASIKCVWSWSRNGRAVKQDRVIEKLTEIFHYYTDFDTKIQKADRKDSIVNHVGEAFAHWSIDNSPKKAHFEIRV
jgi:hypothetical protein